MTHKQNAAVSTLIVGLVPCTKSKLKGGPHAARELYSPSWNYRQMVKYLEDHRGVDEWLILSAKYGLLHPDTMVETYDETLSGARKAVRDEWAEGVRQALKERYAGRPVKFVLMAGRDYVGCVKGVEELMGAQVERPLKGLGKGVGPIRTFLGQFA